MQSAGLREDALFDLIGYDAIATRARPGAWISSVVVCNPAARARRGVAEVEVFVVREHVRVGPASGGGNTMPIGAPSPSWRLGKGAIPVQRLTSKRRHERLESSQHYPWNDFVESTTALAWVPPIAGYGTRAFVLDDEGTSSGSLAPEQVRAEGLAIENGTMRIEADARGVVRLSTPDGARSIASLLSIESVTDAGDLYTPSPRGAPRFAEFANPRLTLRGPLRAALVLQWRVEFYDQLRMLAPRAAVGTVTLTLDAGAAFLRVDVHGDSGLLDHRLRLRITTDVQDADIFADAAFGPVRREIVVAPVGAAESVPPTAPLARYVTLTAPDRGATVYSDGLGEYEVLEDGAVALTLLRAVGELSRNDLPERPGHAGWPASTPEAQEPGEFGGRFALMLHGARDDATIAQIERAADDVLHPLAGRTVRSATPLPATTDGVSLEGEGLSLSAIKTSEDGVWMVLRCVNLTGHEIAGAWALGAPVYEARASRLDETPGTILEIQDKRIPFLAPPRAILSVLVR